MYYNIFMKIIESNRGKFEIILKLVRALINYRFIRQPFLKIIFLSMHLCITMDGIVGYTVDCEH